MFHAQKAQTAPTPDQADAREPETEPAPPADETMPEFETLRVPRGFTNAFGYFCDVYGVDQDLALAMAKYAFGCLADGSVASDVFRVMRPKLNDALIRSMALDLAKKVQAFCETSPVADPPIAEPPTSETTAEPRAQ